MKKVALVFALAVFVPSLVLAWLALRSLRDQQYVLERQRALLYQNVADSLAKDVAGFLFDRQREFAAQVASYTGNQPSSVVGPDFDAFIRKQWPLAEVGFGVTLQSGLTCPSPASSATATLFCSDNGGFLANREVAEVYYNTAANVLNNSAQFPAQALNNNDGNLFAPTNVYQAKLQSRKVNPVGQQSSWAAGPQNVQSGQSQGQSFVSKVASADAEFRLLIGDASDGMLARFVQNKLRLLFWHRQPNSHDPIYGAQIDLAQLIAQLKDTIRIEPALGQNVCVALLDDNARPQALTDSGFQANWKRPFVASEVGEALPHWEIGVYLRNPAQLSQAAQTTRLTLGLLIALLLVAIGVGSWLIVRDLNRQLTLARQKTDFVSNVSHELKTPLTSIRMFSELLSEGRVTEPEKQRSYLNIITAEAARLTRLINNVLDFSRMERGEKEYKFAECDLAGIAKETAETFRPHLESTGFKFDTSLPDSPVKIRADRDAIAQVIVNLLSNAEKYSNGTKEVSLQVTCHTEPVRWAELKVLDRGPGVPAEAKERIFEKFYRANDSLTNNVQGSGLGLTLARQIARAHQGDVAYAPRDGGGSCFTLRLPLIS